MIDIVTHTGPTRKWRWALSCRYGYVAWWSRSAWYLTTQGTWGEVAVSLGRLTFGAHASRGGPGWRWIRREAS